MIVNLISDPHMRIWLIAGGAVLLMLVLLIAAMDDKGDTLNKRLQRVGPHGNLRKITTHQREGRGSLVPHYESSIPILNILVQFIPHPAKLRARLARTGKNITLGEYLLMNCLGLLFFWFLFHTLGWVPVSTAMMAIILGLGLPHMVTGYMGNKRIKKFTAVFPEAIDTMVRGIRSGLPITEAIAAVGREMPDPIGTEFHRISDGIRLGKSLEASMWEVAQRIDTAEFRFLIIAMAIQKETGGNLAETLGNLSDLIRRRRQLRLKIKAMSSEAKASAMIIGSLPFIMFTLLLVVNPDYVLMLTREAKGKVMLGGGLFWMGLGWATMLKMIHFEI